MIVVPSRDDFEATSIYGSEVSLRSDYLDRRNCTLSRRMALETLPGATTEVAVPRRERDLGEHRRLRDDGGFNDTNRAQC
jgi:hypothetical protein